MASLDQQEQIAGYAACALLLDLLYTASNVFKTTDMSTVSIILCVMQNSLRDRAETDGTVLRINSRGPVISSARGISRRAIADKLGFSRETVRRRTNALLELGVLVEDDGGYIHLTSERSVLSAPDELNQFHGCVLSYMERLEAHKIAMPLGRISRRA